MTVYIIVASNGWGDVWNDAVLSSESLAMDYIKKQQDKYFKDNERMDELYNIRDFDRELSDDENHELNELETYWCRCSGVCPTYRIDVFDVLEYIF